jgi:hypothetical protein
MDDGSTPNSEDYEEPFPGLSAWCSGRCHVRALPLPLREPHPSDAAGSHQLPRLARLPEMPERRFMDELIKAYFRYVHPVLPVVDESDFGSAYYQLARGRTVTHVPVMLPQSMLFASCMVRWQSSSLLCFRELRILIVLWLRTSQKT